MCANTNFLYEVPLCAFLNNPRWKLRTILLGHKYPVSVQEVFYKAPGGMVGTSNFRCIPERLALIIN